MSRFPPILALPCRSRLCDVPKLSFIPAVGIISTGIATAAAINDHQEIRSFMARWNDAYTHLDTAALAAMETPDFEMVDRFGHCIKSEKPEFNQRLWAMTFNQIYHRKPRPARQIESVRFMGPRVAIVQARANHPDGVTLDDGTRIPCSGSSTLNIHNQMSPGTEKVVGTRTCGVLVPAHTLSPKHAALSVAHSRNARAGLPVTSATAEVTNAGCPTEAPQASSSMFTTNNGPKYSNSRRASSAEISSTRGEQPTARPIVDSSPFA